MFNIEKFFDFINLHNGEESKQKVLENVSSSITFRGSNLWTLACAIIVASVGLNVNSTAVIIGAMLISPLMGPIVGAGFALGTYDAGLLKRCFKNLFVATIVSLMVSTVYFMLSPFKDAQSELLGRTAPNIYDVLIAFFGGLVGAIAITRVEKGNPIPGVAIATALMPPLCTAGYGLATSNYTYFFGAFYLYSINCFFICIATFIVIKYLKYPVAADIDKKHINQVKYGITALVLIMIIPSCYLAYELWNKNRLTKIVEEFIDTEFNNKGYTIIYKKLDLGTSPRKVDLAFLNKEFDKEELQMYNRLLIEKGVGNSELRFLQYGADLKTEIMKEIKAKNKVFSQKDLRINELEKDLNKYKIKDTGLVKEIKALHPQLKNIVIGKANKYSENDSVAIIPLVIYHAVYPITSVEENKLQEWLKLRLHSKDILLVYNPAR